MSKVKIEGNASGTGTLTIAAPNTNTDRTLTLPDGAGEILTNGTNSNFPAGSVLQVVEGTLGTQVGSTATSFTSLFSASITPSSTSSKIVAMYTVPSYLTSGAGLFITMYRGSTDLSGNSLSRGFSQLTAANGWFQPASAVFLDSPAATSSTTYSVQFKTNGTTCYLGQDGSGKLATLLLMEIAG